MIRRAAIKFNIPYATTIAGAMAICKGITALKKKKLSVKAIQEYNSCLGQIRKGTC
jgi:carbamoyl-phosphate synthase large subunit